MKKRFLASLLSLVMLLTMLPVTAFAAEGDNTLKEQATALTVTATKETSSTEPAKTTFKSVTVKEGSPENLTDVASYKYVLSETKLDDTTIVGKDLVWQEKPTDWTTVEVTDGKTYLAIAVFDEQTTTQINSWGCAEITDASEQTPPAGNTGSLTLDDSDTNVTVAADKKTVTLSNKDVTVDFNVKKGYAPKAANSNPSTKVAVTFALKTAATADADAVWTATISGASEANVTTAETITLTAEKIAFTVVAGDTNVQIAEANKNVDLSASYTLEVTATENYKPKDIANTITFSQKNSTTTWTGTFADTYVGPGVGENGTALSLTIESESTGSVTPTGSLTVTKGADANITLADDVEVDLTKAEATVINFEAKKGYKVSASAVQGVTVALAINKTPDTTPASGNVAWTATISGAKDANITDAKTITLSSAAMTLTLDVSDANVSADKTSINLTEGNTFTVKVKENFEPTCTVNGITFAKTGSTADADGNIEWTFTVADDFTGTEDDVVIASVTAGTKYAVTVNIPTADTEKASVITASSTLTDISNGGTAVIVLKVKDGFTVSGTYGADNTALNFTEDDSVTAGTGFTAYKAEIKPVSANLTVAITVAETNPPAAEKYTIKFAAGTGTGTMADVEYSKAATGVTEYPLPECTFNAPAADKEFDAWTVTGEGLAISGNKLTIAATVATETPITLTATWKDKAPAADSDTTVTTTPEVSNGTASSDFTSTVTEDKAGELVEAAEGAESAADKVVTLDASEVTGDTAVEKAEVTIPTTIVNAVNGSTADIKLAVATPVGTVTLPKAAVAEVKAANVAVKLSIAPPAETVPTGVTMVDVKFVKANAATETVEVKSPVTLKLKAPANATSVFAYLYKKVDNAFKAFKIPGATNAINVINGFVTFEAPHLSYYGLTKDADEDAKEEPTEPESPLSVTMAKDSNGHHGLATINGVTSGKSYLVQITVGNSDPVYTVMTATSDKLEVYTAIPSATKKVVVDVWQLKNGTTPFVGLGVHNVDYMSDGKTPIRSVGNEFTSVNSAN